MSYDQYGNYLGPDFAPQGFFGNLAGQFAPHVGQAIGRQFGQGQLGGQVGQMLGGLGRMIPFEAGPELAPQGFFGNLASQFAPHVGQAIGRQFGQGQIGGQVGQMLGGLGRMIPFEAGPELAPQGFFGNLASQFAPHVGQAIGRQFGQGQIGGQVGQMLGGLGRMIPFEAGPELAPQGFFGNLASQFAPHVGQAIGRQFGQGQIGGQVGQMLGGLGRMIPFEAGPELAPQGFFGNLAGQFAPHVGQLVGRQFGQGQLGGQVGQMLGGLGRMIPFEAGPELAPQGFFGNLAGQFAPHVGQLVGRQFGQGQLGGQVGQMLGGLGRMIPFEAGPELAPQGFFGNLAGQFAPHVGQLVGRQFGQGQLGGQVGQMLGGLGRMIPFEAGPELAPQGFFGNLAGQFAPHVGQLVGRQFGQGQLGGQVGQMLGGLGRMIPFEAGPELAPQGFFGNLAGQFAPHVGQLVGRQFGQGQLGGQVGQMLGGLGRMIPFDAGPQFAPQGFFGNLAGQYGPQLGQAIGGHFGQGQIGEQIGNLLGGLGRIVPFDAGAPAYYTGAPVY